MDPIYFGRFWNSKILEMNVLCGLGQAIDSLRGSYFQLMRDATDSGLTTRIQRTNAVSKKRETIGRQLEGTPLEPQSG
jgi:hypothetical protein